MSISVQTETPPLRRDASGAYRVGDSQVLLEIVVEQFESGATPEAIVQQFPTTNLVDVYAVIAYYLRHRDDVATYLQEREAVAAAIRAKVENSQRDLRDLRERLRTAVKPRE